MSDIWQHSCRQLAADGCLYCGVKTQQSKQTYMCMLMSSPGIHVVNISHYRDCVDYIISIYVVNCSFSYAHHLHMSVIVSTLSNHYKYCVSLFIRVVSFTEVRHSVWTLYMKLLFQQAKIFLSCFQFDTKSTGCIG